ncbi:MAG: secondary thiamine-phosphate synthase enzyme YjbQ [Pseudomonadota bacterium]|nr:secondary thiamine-phosphate synthase enzyme YjbQ [Pseudomonadota bacterium]HJO36273.1 secondary thiamine-phosphate synthase enzyme YjbQ [Gammaproteobacteria bacterium]
MIRQHTLALTTDGRGSYEITGQIQPLVRQSGIGAGLCHLFVCHTSASLMVMENADPDVRHDLETLLARLAPDGDPAYRHTLEGADDMAAHARTLLTQVSLTLPVSDGRCRLGTWQGVFLYEHRYRPHRREIIVTLHGE